jgi:hypothetical protein
MGTRRTLSEGIGSWARRLAVSRVRPRSPAGATVVVALLLLIVGLHVAPGPHERCRQEPLPSHGCDTPISDETPVPVEGFANVAAVGSAGASRPTASFVTACGSELCLLGRAWRMHAASDYNTTATAARRAAMAGSAGINTLRLVALLDEAGSPTAAPYDEARWIGVDERIAAAGRHGLKVLVDLSTYRNLLANAGIEPYTHDWGPFLQVLLNRRNTVTGVRYAEDPTIAMFSLAGEVEPEPRRAAGTRARRDVTEFFLRTLLQAKAIDGNHLWSSGGLLHLDWDSGIEWRTIMSLRQNDVCSIHNYSAQDTTVTTPQVAQHCRDLGKPWITEEFGYPQSLGDAERARRFRAMFELQRRHGVAGVGFWNLGDELAPSSHDVNEQTPAVWAALRENAPARAAG